MDSPAGISALPAAPVPASMGNLAHQQCPASLIGPSGSSTFRLSTNAVSMSLAGSCFSSESAPGPLYGVFFVKELARAAKLSFVGFLVRSQSPFLRPDLRIADVDARKICTRLAVTPTLRHASPLPGHTMTASSTTAR